MTQEAGGNKDFLCVSVKDEFSKVLNADRQLMSVLGRHGAALIPVMEASGSRVVEKFVVAKDLRPLERGEETAIKPDLEGCKAIKACWLERMDIKNAQP